MNILVTVLREYSKIDWESQGLLKSTNAGYIGYCLPPPFNACYDNPEDIKKDFNCVVPLLMDTFDKSVPHV